MSSIDWREHFHYDETSPSCLTRVKPWLAGAKHGVVRAPAGSPVGTQRKDGYWQVTVDGQKYLAHRVVYEMHGCVVPEGFEIDHENGITSDTVFSNLRLVTRKVNSRNQKKRATNSSGVTGVHRAEQTRGTYTTVYWVASWNEVDGSEKKKSFPVASLGEVEAKAQAVACREAAIAYLNAKGAGYTEQHGDRVLTNE